MLYSVLDGVISEKTEFLMATAVRSSSPTYARARLNSEFCCGLVEEHLVMQRSMLVRCTL
jgi:hypothetical protein